MANVDPFVIQWPRKWLVDPEVEPVIHYLNRFLHDLFLRTGGGDDAIESTDQALTSTNSRVSRNAARINSIELKEFEIVTTTTDITTEEYQIIICKNTSSIINVTLDPNAIKDDEVHIKRRESTVNVVGSIDGFTNKIINIKNYSMHLVYDGTDWSEI